MAKKELVDKIGQEISDQSLHNPLMASLRENDKRHLFNTTAMSYFHKTGFPLFDYHFGSVINIHDDTGKIIRQEPRVGQAAGTFNMVVGNTGTGKALPDGTLLPTPSGWRALRDLKVGDSVFGPDGLPTKILGVYPQGEKEIWEVECDNGCSAKCSEDHLWTYSRKHHDAPPEMEITTNTEELKRYASSAVKSRKPILPQIKPLQFDEQPLNLPPYLLGLAIGDGNKFEALLAMLDAPYIEDVKNTDYNLTHPIMKRLREAVYYCRAKFNSKYGNQTGWSRVLREIIESNTIPQEYLCNTIQVRLELFRGITDGRDNVKHRDNRFGRSIILSWVVRSGFTKGLIDLVLGLGLQFKLAGADMLFNRLHVTGYFDHTYLSVISLTGKFSKALTKLMGSGELQPTDYRPRVIRVKPTSEFAQMTCIKVDREDGLFVTENYLVTHNTTLVVQMAANIIRPYEKGLVVHYDFEQRFDISRAENITKLPIWEFDSGGRYILQQGMMSLEDTQEAIVKLYAAKVGRREELLEATGQFDEFGHEIKTLPPTVIILDSVSNIIPDTFSVGNAKDLAMAEKLRNNMAGARDAKTMRGFLRDIAPLLKQGNIIIYAINHINSSVQISMFSGPTKQMNFLKADEAIPGGKALFYNSFNLVKMISKPSDDFTEATDGFAGHMVMIEPVKSSSNQSGNNSKGISFDMVFSYKNGFDSLRSLIMYGREKGLIEGTKPRLKFVGDPSFTFAWKEIDTEKNEKPIWESIRKFIIPELESHLSFVEPVAFDERSMDY